MERLASVFGGRQMVVLIAVVLGSAVAILDGTIVNLALPKIGAQWNTGYSGLQWISDAYLLSLSSLILLGGSLGDILGRKKIYLVGVAGFGLTSFVCALSQDAAMLISLRIIQGVFGALLVPGALAIITITFKSKDRPVAFGRWTAWTSVATVLSPFVGGWILAVASWRWIFLVNVPIAAVCYALASYAVTETKDTRARSIDWVGALLAAASLSGMTYGLIEGPTGHWSASTILPLSFGILLAVAFVAYEWRAKDPMVKLSLFKSQNFVGSNLMTFLMYGALGGFAFSMVIYLQTHLHYSAFFAGLSMLPISICMILFSGRVGYFASRFGSRFFMTVGPIVAGVGMLLLFFLRPGDSYILGVLPGTLLFAVGLTLLVSPLTTTVMASVGEHDSGIASGINNAVARSAGLIIVATLGLFGAAQAYTFAMGLCAVLAILSGVISFGIIRNIHRTQASETETPIA